MSDLAAPGLLDDLFYLLLNINDFERISNIMSSDEFYNYLVARKGKYATLAQIIKEIT